MKLNWIRVDTRKPNKDEEVFVLFGNHEDRPEIVIATWSDSRDDFIDDRLQSQYSIYWMPICYHYKRRKLKA
jgi:hypothetical protein